MTSESAFALPASIEIPAEPYTEEEAATLTRAIFAHLDVPQRRSQPAGKTILIDFFGIANAGKTKTTENIDRYFRRETFQVLCPPETAEIDEIRNKSTDNILVFQARHVAGVEDYVLNLAHNRDYHLAVVSRGLIDMLYWYERWVREGRAPEAHRTQARNRIYSLLELDLVDAFFFFMCSVEEAMRREYSGSITKKRGSNMNEEKLVEAHDIYRAVLDHLNTHIPGLPLFTIDTTHLDVGETAREVMRYLLPTLCNRFGILGSIVTPRSPGLMQRALQRITNFQEQVKLRGHVSREILERAGWVLEKTVEHCDTYLDVRLDRTEPYNAFGTLARIRETRIEGKEKVMRFQLGSTTSERLCLRRHPCEFAVSEHEAQDIANLYPLIRILAKKRAYYALHREPSNPDDVYMSVCVDTVEGLGTFTEIRAIGGPKRTYAHALLELATQLGFTPADIVEGSYLAMALNQQY